MAFVGSAVAEEDYKGFKTKTPAIMKHTVEQNNQGLDPPSNDECPGAVSIPSMVPVCSPITTGVLMATPGTAGPNGTDPNNCVVTGDDFIANTIWYTYVPPVTAFYTLITCKGASCGTGTTTSTQSDGAIAIYSSAAGCTGPFTQVACNDDGCGAAGLSKTPPAVLTAGTTYYIMAGNWCRSTNQPACGDVDRYEIRIELANPPPNDQCANATPLQLDMPTEGFTNPLTVNDYQAPAACFTSAFQVGNVASPANGRDVTYSFTAPNEGDYSFYLKHYNSGDRNTTGPDPVLYISADCPATQGEIPNCLYAANRTTTVPPTGATIGGSEEAMCVHLTNGQTVFPIVDEVAAGVDGHFFIEAYRCVLEREFNGSPASADDVDSDGDGTGDGPNSATAACPVEGQILTFPGFPDVDFYTLGSHAGSRLFAIADCDAANPRPDTAASTNIDMRVTTSTSTLEFDDQDSATDFGTLCPNVAGTPLTAANAYIRLNAVSTTISYEPYRLHTVLRAPGPNPPFVAGFGTSATGEIAEPNDTTLQFSDYVYGDHLDANDGGYDYYAFAARKGDYIMVNVDGDPERDGTAHANFVVLFDTHGSPAPVPPFGVAAAAASNQTASPGTLTGTTPRSNGDVLVHRAAETGIYIVAVISNDAGGGTYLYQASLNCNSTANGGGLDADMSISKTGPAAATAGQDITYTVVVTNNGPNPAALAFWTDNVPAGTTFVSLEPADGWTCVTPNPGDTGAIECDEDSGAFDGSATFTLTVHVAPCSGSGVVSNTAEAASATGDSNPANNTSTAQTTVVDPGTCDDGDQCTIGDHCEGGACVGTGPANCDDNNACTDDTCDAVLGCQHANNTSACDDGNSCTNNDTCSNGACTGTNAPAGQACTGDTNVCTTDGCDGNGHCISVPNNLPCDDGSACTTGDHCSNGTCSGAAVCCDDGNICTTDSCDPIQGCVNTCNNNCNAKNEGYWKKLCNKRGSETPCSTDDHGDDHGEFLTQKDVDCVNNSCTFADVTTVDQLCGVLDDHGGDKCVKAEKKFMSLLLNVCRCRLNPGQTIDTHCDPHHQTVAQVIAHEDATLCNPARTQEQCKHPDCSSDELISGEALWQNTLRVTRQGTAIRLTWSAVYGDPTGEAPRKYRLWRHLKGGSYVMIGEVNANTFSFLDTTVGPGDYWYEVTATY